jgi:hypothetical protein
MKLETLLLLSLFTSHPHHTLFRDEHSKKPTWDEHRADYERHAFPRSMRYATNAPAYPSTSRTNRITM